MSQPHSTDSHPRDPARPRIRPGGFRELGPVGWAVNRVGARVTGSRDVHLFATLGRARRLFPAWLAYSGMMMPFGVLDRRTTELVILRARKGGRAGFRLHAPLILHAGDRHERDGESYRPEIRAVLRDGAALPWPA